MPKDAVKNGHKKSSVKPKKHLGQHFLKDGAIAEKIAGTLSFEKYKRVLEIGPGTGILTKYLLQKDIDLVAMDVDSESVQYLNQKFAQDRKNNDFTIVGADFLKHDLKELFNDQQFAIIGNFPYNISSQIVFKTLQICSQVPEFSGMFQKEVAQRICAKEGSKTYGILSVLTQAYYNAEYLFTVPPQVFHPPPKVESGVIRLTRKNPYHLECNEALFQRVVKTAFNQRRKTLRNSLKSLGLSDYLKEDAIFDRRPEQLSVADFMALVKKIGNDSV